MIEKTFKSIEPINPASEKNPKFCIGCGELATRIVKYDTEGAIIVEKYCDKCAKEIHGSQN